MKRDLPPGASGDDPEREVREEIRFHLEERARELEAEGMDPEEARREAGRTFGDVERIAARSARIRRGRQRDEGRTRMKSALMQDLKIAVRGLLKRPGFAAVVVATLALGIGGVTSVFTVANAALLRSLPFEDADRLVFLQGAYMAEEGPRVRGSSYPEARDWVEMAGSFERASAWNSTAVNVTGDQGAERLAAEQVDAGYFELLRVSPALGRTFREEELRQGGDGAVALLGHGLWTRRFGADPDVLGRPIRLNDRAVTVVGVLPEGFGGLSLNADVWLPMLAPDLGIGGSVDSRGSRFLSVVARLRADVEREAAQREMDGIAARLEEAHPEVHEDRVVLVTPLREAFLGDTRTLVLLVLAGAALLLVIGAANVTNLLLVRSTGRVREVQMRRALGAGRGRLVGQFLVEGAVLALLGAATGLGLGVVGARALTAVMPDGLLPAFVEAAPDPVVFLLAAALLAGVALLAGLTPALASVRSDVAGGLRERAGGTGGRDRGRLQSALVVGEVALALLLLVGAGLMVRSFSAQLAVDPGFDSERLVGFRVQLPAERYGDEDALRASAEELLRQLDAVPGVEAATVGSDAPLRGGFSAFYVFREGDGPDDRIRFYIHRVHRGWFDALGTEVVRGRGFDGQDMEDAAAAVVSRAMAERVFPGEDPVGRTLRVGSPDGLRLHVVGVAEDVRYRDLTSDIVTGGDDPDAYAPWEAFPSRILNIVLRTDGDPAALEQRVRETVRAFDPDLPVFGLLPLHEALRAQTAQARFGTLLLSVFSGLAVLLSVVGLYGILAFSVDRRRREIAVRMAVGAGAGQVRRLVVIRGMRLVAAGSVLGLLAAWWGSRGLQAFLFGVEPVDPATYAAVTALLAGVALLAAWIPAVRATRVDPQRALATE